MNVAVLIFGQPRFFDKTAQLIKDEFTIPGWSTEFFIHNWDKVGHTPQCDEMERFEEEPDVSKIRKILHPMCYVRDSYDIITEYTTNFLNSLKKINRKIPFSKDYMKERYYFGQHISIQKCYQEIIKYEEKTQQTFDLIIKVRTDIIYKNQHFYKDINEYNNIKKEQYYIKDTIYPTCKVNALRINRFNIDTQKWVGENLSNFYENKYTTLESKEQKEYIWNYWERLCFNDWSLVCNRSAADIYFNNWFENLFITIGKDLTNNKTKNKWLARSEHTMQGQLGLNYNVNLIRMGKRRDRKVICEFRVKNDIDTTGKILLKPNESEHILYKKINELFK